MRGREWSEDDGRVASTEPLSVGPDVVVLGVEGEDVGEEGDFGVVEEGGGLVVLGRRGGEGKEGEEGLAVVPGGTLISGRWRGLLMQELVQPE